MMAWEFNVQKVIAQSLAQPHDRGDDLIADRAGIAAGAAICGSTASKPPW